MEDTELNMFGIDTSTFPEDNLTEEEVSARRPAKEQESSLLDVASGSMRYDTTPGLLWRTVQESMIDPEPTENFDPIERTESLQLDPYVYGKDITEMLADTTNEDQFEYILQEAESEHKLEEETKLAGLPGYATRMLTSVVGDPLTYIPILGTLAKVKTGTRLGSIAVGAASAGVETWVTESLLAAKSAHRDEVDVAYMTAGAIALGGAFGGVFHSAGKAQVKKLSNDIQDTMDRDLSEEVTGIKVPGNAERKAAASDEAMRQVYEKHGVVGADLRVGEQGTKKIAPINALHQTMGGKSERWANEHATELGGDMMSKASGTGGKETLNFSAAHYVDVFRQQLEDKLTPRYTKALREFVVEGADNIIGKTKNLFMKNVDPGYENRFGKHIAKELDARNEGRTVDYSNLSDRATKAIKEAADAHQETTDLMVEMQIKAGVIPPEAADALRDVEGYRARKWNGASMVEAESKNKGIVQALIHKAIKTANPEFEDFYVAKIAKAYKRRFVDKATKNQHENHVTHDSIDFIMESLDDTMGKKELAKLREALEGRKLGDDAGKTSHLKRRIKMDMSTEVQMPDGTKLSLYDLQSTNLHTNTVRQIRTVAGESALKNKGITQASFETSKQRIRTEMMESWSDSGFKSAADAAKESEKIIKTLDIVHNQIMGRPTVDSSDATNKAITFIRDWTNIDVLGRMGIAQLAETQNIIAQAGFMHTVRNMPELVKLIRRSEDGTFDVPLMNDIEALTGFKIGDDMERTPYAMREEAGDLMTGHKGGHMYESAVHNLKTAVGIMSGHKHIMQMEQKAQFYLLGSKLNKILRRGVQTASEVKRFNEIGISPATFKKMSDAALKEGSENSFNLQNWTPALKENMMMALHQGNALAIQKQLAGETYEWSASSALGGLLSQFRMFPLTAIEKQGFRAAKMHDKEAFMSIVYGTCIGTMLYTGKVNLRAAGMERADRRKYMKKMLTPGAIVNGSAGLVAALGSTNELVGVADFLSGGKFIGGSAGNSRGTGSGVLDKAPAIGNLNRQGSAVLNLAQHPLTGKAYNRVARGLPLAQTLVGDGMWAGYRQLFDD